MTCHGYSLSRRSLTERLSAARLSNKFDEISYKFICYMQNPINKYIMHIAIGIVNRRFRGSWAFAALCLADSKTPFFAGAKQPSMNAS
jgi:hypothetical protein